MYLLGFDVAVTVTFLLVSAVRTVPVQIARAVWMRTVNDVT